MAENRQRGLLRVVSDLGLRPPEIDTNPGDFTAPDNGIARAAASVAGDFAQLGAKIGQMADHAAAKEGQAAGREAGLDPEFRPTRLNTIRGEAYDRAGLDVYKTRQEIAISEQADQIWRTHRGDPAKLQAALAEARTSWSSTALPEVRSDVEVSWQKHGLTLMREALREQDARARHEAAAAAQEQVAQGLKTIQQRAYALGLDPAADAVLTSDLDKLKGALSRRGPDGNPIVAPEAAAKMIRAAREEVTTARLLGAFSRLPDLESKQKFLDGLRADFSAGTGLAKEYDMDGLRGVERILSAEMTKEVVKVNAEERAVKHEVDQLYQMAGKGYGVPPEQMSALAARVAGMRNPEVAATFDEARGLMTWHEAARKATPDELAAHLDELRTSARKDGANPRLVRQIEIGDRLLGEMRGQLKTDPIGWAARIGLAEPVPLDFTTPEKAALTMRARIAQADAIAARYSIPPQYLRPDEVRQLKTTMEQGGKETLMVAGLISSAGDRAPAIMRQLSEHAPASAFLGGLIARDPQSVVATDAAAGMALRHTLAKDFHPMVAPAPKLRAAAEEVVGGALSRMPENMQAAMDTASAAYEVRARRKGLAEFDPELWKDTFREALGERTIGGEKYGGVYYQSRRWYGRAVEPIILPHDVSEKQFPRVIEALSLNDLKDAQGRTPAAVLPSGKEQPVGISDIRSGTLVTVGAGRYRIALGDPSSPDPQYLVRDGKPFVLDVNQLSDLRRRRADLFLGGEQPRHDGEPAR